MECVDDQRQRQARDGLIFNELCAGHIVWNKIRMVKDPDTSKRLSRPNPREEWQSIEVPQLRIVEQVRLIAGFRALVHSVIPWEGFEVEVNGMLATPVGGEVLPQARYDSGSYVVAALLTHYMSCSLSG